MRVIDVDRMEGDVVLTFEDGLTVIYTGELLRELVPRAQVVLPGDPEPPGAREPKRVR